MSKAFLWFSGARLYLVNSSKNSSWFAVSGKIVSVDGGGAKFQYSAAAQASKDTGPIPAGEYFIRMGDVRVYEHTGRTLVAAAAFLFTEARTDVLDKMNKAWGKMPGARGHIIPILNREGGRTYQFNRTSCWIHGSDSPGSAGCIDLGLHMDQFLDDMMELNVDPKMLIRLVVRYGVTPNGDLEGRDIDAKGNRIDNIG